ncbi:hypothetical protein I4U23_007576 [Adineta vaga]|nr:hypothetical protein I4U23_007576 [Adineta vaga]
MMMINSSPSSQTDSAKRLRLTLPRNNKTDLLTNSNTISSAKFDEKINHLQEKSIDCNNSMTTMKQQLSDSVDNENDTTLLTTTTTTTTVEVKVKTTKTSSSSSSSRKRKLTMVDDTINTNDDNNNGNINKQQQQQEEQQQQSVSKKKKKQRSSNNETNTTNELSNNDTTNHPTHPKTVDQSSVTDESSFGSCEPGTNVVLEGIVWNETDKGVLVVNITWRGKTYVGALLNTTEQNWAPPRYKSDVRPTKHNRHSHHHNHNRDYLLTSTATSSLSSSSPLQSVIPSQLNQNSSSNEPTERILRNGKRRGTYTTVTPSTTSKSNSFKIPEAPRSKSDETLITDKLTDTGSGAPSSSSTSVNDEDETNSISGEKTLVRNGVDDETGDNCSSRSVSPTTSGTSTTSSSPPPSIQEKSIILPQTDNIEPSTPSIPMDLSNTKTTIKIDNNSSSYNNPIVQTPSPSKSSLSSPSSLITPSFLSSFTSKTSKSKTKETLSTPSSLLTPHPFANSLLFSPPTNPTTYYPPSPFLHGPPHSFGLSQFHPHHHSPTSALHSNTNKNKLSPSSSAVSPSSYLSIPPQLYFNPLTTPRFPSVCSTSPSSSLSKSSR